MCGYSVPYFVVTTGWFRASRFDVNPNVGYLASNFRSPLALDDQLQSFAVGCFREAHRVATANAARTVPSTTRQATHSSSRALVPLW